MKTAVLGLVAGTVAAAGAQVWGQGVSNAAGRPAFSPTAVTATDEPRVPAGAPMLTVDFAGGTVGQFVDALRKASPEPVNVVVPAEAREMAVPAVSLKNVPLLAALQTLEFASMTGPQPTPMVRIYELNTRSPAAMSNPAAAPAAGAPAGSPVYALVVQRPFEERTETRVLSLRGMIDMHSSKAAVEEIIKPIEAALSAAAGGADGQVRGRLPELLVHRDSRLLIVKGTPAQVSVAEQVMNQLRQQEAEERARRQSVELYDKELESLRMAHDMKLRSMREMLERYQARLTQYTAATRADGGPEKLSEEERNQARQVEETVRLLQLQITKAELDAADLPERARQQAQVQSASPMVLQLQQQIAAIKQEIAALKAAK